jgi:hypothetical protein
MIASQSYEQRKKLSEGLPGKLFRFDCDIKKHPSMEGAEEECN